jgi:hypothetical protein
MGQGLLTMSETIPINLVRPPVSIQLPICSPYTIRFNKARQLYTMALPVIMAIAMPVMLQASPSLRRQPLQMLQERPTRMPIR